MSQIIFVVNQNYYRVATVVEKSWNFWNFEIFLNFWKSHGISPKIDKGHGKVMEFKIQLMCMSIKRSWNFVIQSWKSHGKVMEFCRDNFVATLY